MEREPDTRTDAAPAAAPPSPTIDAIEDRFHAPRSAAERWRTVCGWGAWLAIPCGILTGRALGGSRTPAGEIASGAFLATAAMLLAAWWILRRRAPRFEVAAPRDTTFGGAPGAQWGRVVATATALPDGWVLRVGPNPTWMIVGQSAGFAIPLGLARLVPAAYELPILLSCWMILGALFEFNPTRIRGLRWSEVEGAYVRGREVTILHGREDLPHPVTLGGTRGQLERAVAILGEHVDVRTIPSAPARKDATATPTSARRTAPEPTPSTAIDARKVRELDETLDTLRRM